ncbi:pyocin knob domain-containing protein [Achromobacter kerstersii]
MPTLETINVGLAPNDKKGDPLRNAMQKVNLNFSALNTAIQGVLDSKGQANGYASLGADGRLLAAQAPVVYSATLPTTTHDLNSYVTPGTFYQTTIAGATAGANYPVANVGFLEVVATGTPVLQIYTTRTNVLASMQRFWRVRQTATLWSVWKEVVDATALAAVKATADAGLLAANAAIPTAQKAAANGVGSLDASGRQPIGQLPAPILLPATAHDLDTYDQDGTYGQNATAGAVAGSNYPPEKVAGVLTVQRGGAGNIQAHQWYRTYFTENSTVYYRNKTTAGWGNWVRLAKFSEAMTHTFLTTATDANTLAADNTFYTFTSATPFTGGSNWPPTSSIIGGLVEVAYLDGGRVIQTCTLPVGNGKPRIFQRYGDPRAGGSWQAWRMIGAVSSTGWLPSADAGDVYVDGVGWHLWNGSAYVWEGYCARLPTTAHDLNTYTTPGEYFQAVNAGASAGTNYPTASAGFMKVTGENSAAIMQEYTVRATSAAGVRRYVRVQTSSLGAWTAWAELAKFSDAMTHTFLTAATDANTLIADNTFYTWTASAVADGANFPGYAAAGYMQVFWQAAAVVSQQLTLLVTGGKPLKFERFGNSSTGVWQPWKVTSAFNSAAWMPASDMGDIYVDGLGWHRWNGTGYAKVPAQATKYRTGLQTRVASVQAITVLSGACASASGNADLVLAADSTRTLQASGAFVHGTTGNALLAGARAANTWYFVFLIRRDSDGSVAVAFDSTPNCANRPAAYTEYRRVGCIRTDGNAAIWAYTQTGNRFAFDTNVRIYTADTLVGGTTYQPSTGTPYGVAHTVHCVAWVTYSAGPTAPLVSLSRPTSSGTYSEATYICLGNVNNNHISYFDAPMPNLGTTPNFRISSGQSGALTLWVTGFTDHFED